MSAEARVRVEVLGPLRVLDEAGREISPRGHLQQRLLALLALHRGRVVSAEKAIDALWPDSRPDDPVAALQNHLSRLRRGLPAGLIESVGDGYRLDPAGVEVDAQVFSDLLTADPATHPDLLERIDAVLERWSGPAYPELDEVDDARVEAMRLEELRTRARETRAEARLALARTDGLVAELTTLCDAEPLRERPRALLMQTLTATGRHAEALRVYDDFRLLLSNELGTEPSPALAAQHLDLLAGATAPAWTSATALPVPTTSLVGRQQLVEEVALLARGERLVSLVGPGGVGKTRLLLEVGQVLDAGRPDRPVVLCELATSDAESVVDVVAASLGIDARPGTPVADHVPRVLAGSDLVLLLDNCEHVLDPAADLVERLLARCPGVRLVVSSRERLRVGGEQVCLVPPLSADSTDAPAVDLFLERARAVVPRFVPDQAQLARIGEIVRRLDGLPLAIELAAARLHTHEIDEIAAGLDQRFSLLSDGYRTSSRHGSLRAAVSWSYGLLDGGLQEIFTNLSMFAGAFGAADAAAICDADIEQVGPAISQLVERSLVMRSPGRGYVLLETLRAFGRDQLSETGRLDTLAARHAEHQLRWVTGADQRLAVPGTQVLAEIDDNVPELRSALHWLLALGEVEGAGQLVAALLDFGVFRLRPDVLGWAERVVEADPDDRSRYASRVWVVAAYAAWMRGDIEQMGACCERAIGVSRRDDDPRGEVLVVMGTFALIHGRLDEAADWYQQAVDVATGTDPAERLMAVGSLLLPLGYAGDPRAHELADALLAEIADSPTPYAAYIWYCAGEADLASDVDRARARMTRAIELGEATLASFATDMAGATLASLDARAGDAEAAVDAYRQLLLHWRRAGMWSTQWTMLRSIASLLARLGRHGDAAVLEGAVRSTRAGHRIFGQDEEHLRELGTRLRAALGDGPYEEARRRGAELDGRAAVEFALRAL